MFTHHWFQYLALFIGVDLLIQLIWIPIFRIVTTVVLQAGEIPFVSYQNLVLIIRHHPLVVLALLVELLGLLLVVYGQFALVLLGIQQIRQGQFRIRQLLRTVVHQLASLRPGSLGVLLVYFLLVIPFADLVFRTPLLAKVQIPQFILDYLTRNSLLVTLLALLYALVLVLGIRLIDALPLMIYQGQRPRLALAMSWWSTGHRQWWPLLARIIVIGVLATAVMVFFYALTVGTQFGADRLLGAGAYYFAVGDLLVIQLGSEFLAAWAGTITVAILFKSLLIDQPNARVKTSRWGRVTIAIALGVVIIVSVIGNALYLSGGWDRRPVTISHRGVADENGVQNTIPALQKTHRLHPNYVEMDVHETKDHQFVVLHDKNLAELTGVDKTPHQLTLRQLTRLTARENGHRAKIASFDDYLRAADHLHQRLLVEVKTTPQDSPGMLRRFARRYGTTLVRHHDQVHSLNYRVVKQLRKLDPRLTVLYVQPYNFTYPNTAASGYSMEYSTLTDDFIDLAHLQGKIVYAWTINDEVVMKQMMYKNVDGVITDNLVELNQAIADYEHQQSYGRRLLNYIMVVPTRAEFTL